MVINLTSRIITNLVISSHLDRSLPFSRHSIIVLCNFIKLLYLFNYFESNRTDYPYSYLIVEKLWGLAILSNLFQILWLNSRKLVLREESSGLFWHIVFRISIILHHTLARMSAPGIIPVQWQGFVQQMANSSDEKTKASHSSVPTQWP